MLYFVFIFTFIFLFFLLSSFMHIAQFRLKRVRVFFVFRQVKKPLLAKCIIPWSSFFISINLLQYLLSSILASLSVRHTIASADIYAFCQILYTVLIQKTFVAHMKSFAFWWEKHFWSTPLPERLKRFKRFNGVIWLHNSPH